jgi:hypothetical protein
MHMGIGKKNKKDSILIEHIISRFLKKELKYDSDSFDSLKDILELPIKSLKGVEGIESAQITKIFKCRTIEELAKLNPINPIEAILPDPSKEEMSTPEIYEKKARDIIENALQKIPNFEDFRNHIAIAQMIERAWSKRSTYLKKKETKVICVGLDNAGKTAILTGLGGKLGIDQLGKLKPTKKIERRRISTSSLDLHIWDFGGQRDYRRDYLAKPEVYFVGSDLLLYVLDMQDPERYNESFNYLVEILDVTKLLGERPYILAFMHKSDPDIMNDPDYQLNAEYVADKLNFHLSKYNYVYDIYVTSIYNFFTTEPKFSKIIKETLSDKESLNNPMIRKIEGLGDILDSTLNAMVMLANNLSTQIEKISQRMDDLELKVERLYVPLPQTASQRRTKAVASTPSENSSQVIYTKKNIPEPKVHAPEKLLEEDGKDDRLVILQELSSLFQAKKNLDTKSPLGSLGSLGKKFKKSTQKEKE